MECSVIWQMLCSDISIWIIFLSVFAQLCTAQLEKDAKMIRIYQME